ncbi:hypothetical protein KI387_006070, partial [Taxus chinensis]
KRFLLSPPTLMPPKLDHPLILYSRATNVSLACMLAQEDDNKRERVIYFISRTLLDYETRYTQAERECLAIVFATKRLRHYMLNQETKVM